MKLENLLQDRKRSLVNAQEMPAISPNYAMLPTN